jgi:hypothetical protein
MRNDGHSGQLKILSKNVLNIWMERVTFNERSKFILEKFIRYQSKKWISKKVFNFYFQKVLKLKRNSIHKINNVTI